MGLDESFPCRHPFSSTEILKNGQGDVVNILISVRAGIRRCELVSSCVSAQLLLLG